jgi:hypothetical protein
VSVQWLTSCHLAFFCTSKDGFVAFRRGELLCGNLGKKTLGGDSKSGLFYVLIRDFGALQVNKWAQLMDTVLQPPPAHCPWRLR